MEVSMASSFSPPAAAPRPQPNEADQTTKAKQAERSEPTEAEQARLADTARKEAEKKSQPVVNAQGQTTGRIVNTSA